MSAGGEAANHTDVANEDQRHGPINGWKNLFAFTVKPHLFISVPAILCSALAGFLLPVMSLYFGKFFDSFSDFASGDIDGDTFMAQERDNFYGLFLVGGATFLLKGTLFSLWLVFGELQARRVRELLFASLLDRDIEWYEARRNGVGSLLTSIQRQIRDLHLATSQPFGLIVVAFVQAIVGLVLAITTNWKLALVVLSGVPVIAIGATMISRGLAANIERQNGELTTATKIASHCITNIVTVKCFNTQEQEAGNYIKALKRAAVFASKQAFSNALQIGFVRFASTAMFVQGFWYGGTQVHSGQTTTGKVVTTFWASMIAMKGFEDMLPHLVIINKGKASATALRAILTKVGKGKRQVQKVDGLSPQFCDGNIEIREVSFAYPLAPDKLALQCCTLYFPTGQTTFVVGKSGSGKSTLSNLLMRFYRPQTGTVVIDDNNIEELDTHWLRNNITLVQQNCILFSDTISRNIAFGHKNFEQVTDAQIDECINMAVLDSTISALPDGVQTKVGRGGSSLSGGQKQRVAIARARLRDTPILVLDEATSALDNASKVRVVNEIRQWRRGRTTIIITHDLSQIEDEDFVYVLEGGILIAEGRGQEFATASIDKPAKSDDIEHVSVSDHSRSARAQALASHPVRRDSFEFLTSDPNDEQHRRFREDRPQSSVTQSRLWKGVSIGSTAAKTLLKRQSMARAKVMYNIQQNQFLPRASRADHPREGSLYPTVTTPRKSMFMHRIPLTPKFINKALPVPPVQYEALKNDCNDEEVTGKAHAQIRLQSPSSITAVLRTLWPCLDKTYRVKLVLGFLATIGHAGAAPSFSFALVQIFNTYYLTSGYQHKALLWSLVVVGVAISDGVACYIMNYFLGVSSQMWIDTLRSQALHKMLRQPKSWFDQEQNNPATLVSSLDKTAEQIKDLVEKFVAQILAVVVMVIVAVVWSMVNCWKLTIVSIAASPALYAIAKMFEVTSSRWDTRSNITAETINEVFSESFTDIRTVRSLTLESYFEHKYRDATSRAFDVGLRRALYTGVFFGLSESSIAFFTPMIFWYGTSLVKSGEWSITAVFIVFGLLLFCTASANAVITVIPQTTTATDIASRLIRLAHMPTNSHEDLGIVKLDQDDPATLSGPIHFINMTFTYPTRPEIPALRCLNLTIPAGRTTAIVGASGSGKSTITSLLLGLYPPGGDYPWLPNSLDTPPSLTLSGRDIRHLDLRALRSLIAMVPQSPVLLPASVRENIIYGIPPNIPQTSATSIESAAIAAGIHDFILSLPQSYATVIGDGGLTISGGQAQRIVIARALIRDPKILILDEATSALDIESASVVRKSVLQAVKKARENGKTLTVIMVTHAREMMQFADNVVVLEEGKVAEQGRFDEVMGLRRGKLREMLDAGKRMIIEDD